MTETAFEVGVIAVKRALKGPWAAHAWLPAEILPRIPETPPGTRLVAEPEERVYLGSAAVSLHASATAHYRDNLTSARPSLWVVLRPVGEEVELASVTADPYEGEALAESIGDIVESVPMPAEIQARVLAFFEAFHVERTFVKRKRDRADPEALARRRAGRREPESGE
jgi:hypothetical protein